MQKKILMIVDDWEKLERLEHVFEKKYKVSTAPFGSYGLEKIEEELKSGNRFDAILIHCLFENMTEIEIQKKIRSISTYETVPFFYFSNPHPNAAYSSPNDFFIHEPKSFEDILRGVDSYFESLKI